VTININLDSHYLWLSLIVPYLSIAYFVFRRKLKYWAVFAVIWPVAGGLDLFCYMLDKAINKAPSLVALVWYTASAFHVKWYYQSGWYHDFLFAMSQPFPKEPTQGWQAFAAFINWIVSPVTTPIYYLYRLVSDGLLWFLSF
jgi:hypothetical protein